MMIRLLQIAALLALANIASASATITVPGSANIFGAGMATPPDGGGGGAGILPPGFTFPASPGQVLTFSSVSGTVASGNSFDPDGLGPTIFATNMNSVQGISGIKASTAFFLVGIFLDDNAPTASPPATLDFTPASLGPDFAALSPLIGQTFYIGDGRVGSGGAGAIQTFDVPPTATRLFLGIADGQFDGSSVSGAPGNYQDNTGAFTATFEVPEPNCALILLLTTTFRRRRR